MQPWQYLSITFAVAVGAFLSPGFGSDLGPILFSAGLSLAWMLLTIGALALYGRSAFNAFWGAPFALFWPIFIVVFTNANVD